MAAQQGHEAVVRALLERGAEPLQAHAGTGITPLEAGLRSRRYAVVRLLASQSSVYNSLAEETRALVDATMAAGLQVAKDEENGPATSEASGADEPEMGVPFPIPGPTQPLSLIPAVQSGLRLFFSRHNVEPEHFAPVVDVVQRPLGITGGKAFLVSFRFVLKVPRPILCAGTWLDLGPERQAPCIPGQLEFLGLAISQRQAGAAFDLRNWVYAKVFAAMFLLFGDRARIPVLDDAPLPLAPGHTLPNSPYPETMWRPWRVSTAPEGLVVELPWIEGRDLLRGRILLHQDAIGPDEAGPRILGTPQVIFRNLDWQVPAFLNDQDGLASGIMYLGSMP
jgi:hypothetical protein